MTFYSCNQLRVENLMIRDSQQIHVSFEGCNNVKASRLTIDAPQNSPNTDGIHIAGTKNIQINNCAIRTGTYENQNSDPVLTILLRIKTNNVLNIIGDDCISIETGSQSVQATNIICGPGHGIRSEALTLIFI